MKRAMVVMLLCVAVVAFGAMDAQAYINAGVAEKKAGDYSAAATAFLNASEVGKGKLRCVGLRCYIYSLTKAWAEAGIACGDEAVDALAKEFPKDGDADIARATWWNRRCFEMLKAEQPGSAVEFGMRSIEARKDFPVFGNNVAVAYCDMAETKGVATGEAKALAQRALDVLAQYKTDPKLAGTKARAESIIERAK